MSELIRSFVAVSLPDDVSLRLEEYINTLRPLFRVRWVRREQMHITLKFLGELEPEIIDDVKEALTPLKHFEPFTIELDTLGAFPNFRNANVLWLSGSRGAKELGRLSWRVNDVLLERSGLEKDAKKFRAHLTLARLKGETVSDNLINGLGTLPHLQWSCSELVLMRSVLTPQGPVYSRIL